MSGICSAHQGHEPGCEQCNVILFDDVQVEDKPDVRDEHEVKQAIIIRRDLGMRRGKEIAQGSHASIAFLTNAMANLRSFATSFSKPDHAMSQAISLSLDLGLSEAAWKWIDGAFTKVTLQVHSEDELLAVYNKAQALGVESHLIKDSGRTEFHGEDTYTTCAIGPDWVENVDKVTKDLKLY